MRNLLILLFFVCGCTTIFGQPRKPVKKSPPSRLPVEKPRLSPSVPVATNKIAVILKRNSPQVFEWKIEDPGKIPADTLFNEYVSLRVYPEFITLYHYEYSVGAEMQARFTENPLELKEGENIDNRVSSYKFLRDDFSVKISGDILTLTSEETGKVENFRFFLDKSRKKILKLENLKNQNIYLPTKVIISPTPTYKPSPNFK